MSDHDYGLLVQAVGWIEYHAGLDAPEYPHLGVLSSVVDCIGKRREPEVPRERQPDSPGTRMVAYLIGAVGGDTSGGETPGGSAGPLDIPCFYCGGRLPVPADGGEATCLACGLTMDVVDPAAVARRTDTGRPS